MNWPFLITTILLIISYIVVKLSSRNNACKTFEDYYTDRDKNPNCYYNPDAKLTTPEIIKRWGYPVETHKVTTEDGYILTLFRIPYGKNSPTKKPGKPVLLQHGHKSSSGCFVIIGEKSLAFILANAGYDVWLGNFRGTRYSSNHTRLGNTDVEYWDFSFHELGLYDLSAQISYVSKLRNQKIIYIGFSLGTTAATVYSSMRPQEAEDKVKVFIKLAPFVISNGISRYTYFMLNLWYRASPYIHELINGQDKPETEFGKYFWGFLCSPYPFQTYLCHIPNMWSIGFSYDQMDPETFTIAFSQLRETASARTTTHLSQMIVTEEFRHYDYGTEGNLKKYGTEAAPPYNLENMRVPVHLVASKNDWLSALEGVKKFYGLLPARVKPYEMYVVEHDEFNHMDFVWAKDVVPLLYDHLVEFMGKF